MFRSAGRRVFGLHLLQALLRQLEEAGLYTRESQTRQLRLA